MRLAVRKAVVALACTGVFAGLGAGTAQLRGQATDATDATAKPETTATFHFEHVGAPVPVYSFKVWESGAVEYREGNANAPKVLHLASALTSRIFAQLRETGGFRGGCNSKAKNLADTGVKILTLAPADGPATTCTYNFSDSKPVTALTELFQAMEVTLEMGQKLEHDHRFDRLGLDEEMRFLVEATKDGRVAGSA